MSEDKLAQNSSKGCTWTYFHFKNIFFCAKIVKGRVKSVSSKSSPDTPNMEPTPNHDCHVSRNTANSSVTNLAALLRSTQVGNGDKLSEICPEMEVIRWTSMSIRLIIRYNEIQLDNYNEI